MSDIKRIAITTISEPKKPTDNNDKQVATKTIRFDLNLFEPNADSFPELNYAKLLYLEKKKLKKITKLNGADPFEDLDNNDDEVAKIAKEFERKYGNNSSYIASTRPNNEYSDKGAGYDESDSFIDNTEAYDEIIPDEIETDRGGFYINSGALEFKHLSNFERPEDALRMPKPKKRIRELSSSEEDDDDDDNENENEEESIAVVEDVDTAPTEKKQKISYDEMKKLKPYKDKTKDKKIEKSKTENDTKGNEIVVVTDPEKIIKTTTVKDMLRAKRDNFRSMQEGNKSDTEESEKESSSSISSDSSDEESNNFITIDDDETKKKQLTENLNNQNEEIEQRQPPEHLSDEIVKIIITLKELSSPNAAGKSTLFDMKNSELFLKLESLTRSLPSKMKNDIYDYMESLLSCTKEEILSEIKKFKTEQLENRIKRQLYKLKKAVAEIMPSLITAHDAENAKLYEMRANLNNLNGGEKIDFQMKPLRKRFQFNDNVRTLLYDVGSTRKLLYSLKSRKESFDDYLENYLKLSILPIWPNGWMRIDELNKELDKKKFSRKIHDGSYKKSSDNSTTKSGKERSKHESSTNVLTLNANDTNKLDKTETAVGTTKLSNTTASNLTITPVAGSITTKTIQNVVSTSAEIPTNSSTNSIEQQLKTNNSNSNAKVHYSSASQLPSSLSISISKHSTSNCNNNNNNNNSVKNVTVNNNSSNTNVTKVSKTSENLTQTKRSSDYSINSIMSSSITSNHSNKSKNSSSTSNAASPKNSHSSDNTSSSVNKGGEKSSVNSIKNKSESISTTMTTTTPITSPGTIKVRSVANMNESVLDNTTKFVKRNDSPINSLLINNRIDDNNKDDDENNSDSSDGVELVGVFPVISKKPCVKTKTVINTNKYNKVIEGLNKSSNSSSSSSTSSNSSTSSINSKSSETSNKSNTCKQQQYPIVLVKKNLSYKNNTNNDNTTIIDHQKDISERKTNSVAPVQPDNKDDLDVNQIMNQIIELQELQQSKNCSASSTTTTPPPTSLTSSSSTNIKNIKTSSNTLKHNSNLQQNTTPNYIKVESTDHSSIMGSEMEDVFHRHHHRTESPSSCQSIIDRSFSIPSAIGNYFTNPATSSQSCDFPHPTLNSTTPLSSNFLISGMLNKIANYQSITQNNNNNNNSTINSELTSYNNNKPSS